jgi:hypothetical protein
LLEIASCGVRELTAQSGTRPGSRSVELVFWLRPGVAVAMHKSNIKGHDASYPFEEGMFLGS